MEGLKGDGFSVDEKVAVDFILFYGCCRGVGRMALSLWERGWMAVRGLMGMYVV